MNQRVLACLRTLILMSLFGFAVQTHAAADESAPFKWNAADYISPSSGISFIRFASSGMGAYPYSYTTPGIGLNVRVDGVPLRSHSPFGPDLDVIPAQFVSGISYDCLSNLDITSIGTTDEETVLITDTMFLLGTRHRFNYDMLFNRNLSARSGIIVGGSSSGIHGGSDNTEKNSIRAYYVKYRRMLENGSPFDFTVRSYRDRDGLINLDNTVLRNGKRSGTHMGERRTDAITVSLGVEKYKIGEDITVSPTVYYQTSNSRFDRAGLRKIIDERSAGFLADVVKTLGNTSYGLRAFSDTRFFDSRLHSDSWTRSENELSASFSQANKRYRFRLESGVMHSSKFGAGLKTTGDASYALKSGNEIVMKGIAAERFPDTGQEYFTSLVYSDTTHVSELETFNISTIETGLRTRNKPYNLGIYAFASYSKLPVFEVSPHLYNKATYTLPDPNTTYLRTGKRERSFGYRVSADAQFEKIYVFDTMIHFSHRPGENNPAFYPVFDCQANLRISGKFINDIMQSTAYAEAQALRWDNSEIKPSGNYFLLDCGLVIRVSSLQLFYTVENVLNEDIEWFNSLGLIGRNTMWGGKWIFYN